MQSLKWHMRHAWTWNIDRRDTATTVIQALTCIARYSTYLCARILLHNVDGVPMFLAHWTPEDSPRVRIQGNNINASEWISALFHRVGFQKLDALHFLELKVTLLANQPVSALWMLCTLYMYMLRCTCTLKAIHTGAETTSYKPGYSSLVIPALSYQALADSETHPTH